MHRCQINALQLISQPLAKKSCVKCFSTTFRIGIWPKFFIWERSCSSKTIFVGKTLNQSISYRTKNLHYIKQETWSPWTSFAQRQVSKMFSCVLHTNCRSARKHDPTYSECCAQQKFVSCEPRPILLMMLGHLQTPSWKRASHQFWLFPHHFHRELI